MIRESGCMSMLFEKNICIKKWHIPSLRDMPEDLNLALIHYGFYTPDRKIKLLGQLFKGDTIDQPPLHDGSIPLTVYILIDDLTDLTICILH